MNLKDEISEHVKSIGVIFFLLAQDRRIHNVELDDFNQSFRMLQEKIDLLFETVTSWMIEAERVCKIEREQIAFKHKMEICLELCGMTKSGIRHLMNFPTRFLELAWAIRFSEGTPLLTETDICWLNTLWDRLNIHIENDIESFSQAKFFKQTYFQVNDSKVKELIILVMKKYKDDLAYLKSKLGKEVGEKELRNLITNQWYEVFRNYTAKEI